MNKKYKNIYGTWTVTTEGDVEGRTIRNLGTYTGYVDEIALHLADKSHYSLKFKKAESINEYTPKKRMVNVQFDIESDTWKGNLDINEIRNIFNDRPVTIEESDYYASFKIISNEIDKITIQNAMNKLTRREKIALGLIKND